MGKGSVAFMFFIVASLSFASLLVVIDARHVLLEEKNKEAAVVVTEVVEVVNKTVTNNIYQEKEVERFVFQAVTPTDECKGVRLNQLEIWTLEGASMQPHLFSWYRALLKDYRGGSLSEGNIVLFRSRTEDEYVLHMVEAVYGDQLMVCSVENPFTDMKICDTLTKKDILKVGCGALWG